MSVARCAGAALWLAAASVAGGQVTAHADVALVVDANGSAQNATNHNQVGELPTTGRIRFARGILRGTFGSVRPWTYLVSIDASGLYAAGDPALTVTDLALTIPLGGHGHVSVGRQKEGVTEQMMAPSRGLPFAERAASVTAFVLTRNDGVRLWGSLPRRHGGWTIGAFNDCLFNGLSLRANGSQAAARVFYAPFVSADSSRAVQIAVDGRWSDDRDGVLDYRTRPEQNAAPNFVNTGPFSASSGLTAAIELMALRENVSFTGALLPTRATGTVDGAVTFLAYHAALSWRPRGESRPWSGETGALGRVRPNGHALTWEVAARASHTDLDDKSVQGGVLDIATLAIGVVGPASTRVFVDYGMSILRSTGTTGRAQLVTLRFQWEHR